LCQTLTTSAAKGLAPSHDNVFAPGADEPASKAINHRHEGFAVEINTVGATDNLLDH